MNNKTWGFIFIFLSVLIIGFVIYRNNTRKEVPLVFASRPMLEALWNSYKKEYIENSGRTLDKQQDNITTSEAESYTMLRAVWADDKTTFDKSWEWTKNNLDRPADNLSAWLFGQRPDGNYGILNERGGQNSASDADTDIALALIFASQRWGDSSYMSQAKAIINDIWEKDVIIIDNRPYLASNDLEKFSRSPAAVINPSYFAPYAYRIFAKIDDPNHDWLGLIDSSFKLIEDSMADPLDKSNTVNLPPDWILINKSTGEIQASSEERLTTNYGFEAFRIPWRLALDWIWFKDQRNKTILDRFSFLTRQWQENKILHNIYSHNGQAVAPQESPAMYGASIGYFLASDPQNLNQILDTKLKTLYNPDTASWKTTLSYYDDNWSWFGLGLYNGYLINLYE